MLKIGKASREDCAVFGVNLGRTCPLAAVQPATEMLADKLHYSRKLIAIPGGQSSSSSRWGY